MSLLISSFYNLLIVCLPECIDICSARWYPIGNQLINSGGFAMQERVALSGAEWRLMQIIWETGPCTLRHICSVAGPVYGWTKHAVISFLKRMEKKGALRVEESPPARRYHALLNREEAIEAETEDVLERVYNGNVLLMVQSAARARGLSKEELSLLATLLSPEGNNNA